MANQATWNLQILAADPTLNVQDQDVYINDGTLTPTGLPAPRFYDGGASAWDNINAYKNPTSPITADGTLTIPKYNTDYFITKGSAASMFIADPIANTNDGLCLKFISTTAFAHSLDNSTGSGFNNGGTLSDKGTWGGAIGDGFAIEAYQGIWYIIPGQNANVSLG